MATDAGMMAKVEAWIKTTLAALTVGEGEAAVDVFTTVDHWRHQIGIGQGGMESFDRYAPFAFVSRADVSTDRQGDYDLRQIISFEVLVGQKSSAEGECRIGSATLLGTSRIRELVIDALDKQHPGAGFACDDMRYVGEHEVVDLPKKHAIQMHFELPWISG